MKRLKKLAVVALSFCLLPDGVSAQVPVNADSLQHAKAVKDTSVFSGLWDCDEFKAGNTKIPVPLKPTGWVSDYEKILTPSQVVWLDSVLSHFEKETGYEIGVVTIDSAWTSKEKFDGYVNSLMQCWGVGKEKEQNGMLIGLSAGLRRVRVSNGAGTRARLSDVATKLIIDNIMIPEFRGANYFMGIKKAIDTIMERLHK